jgi:hypothetical protein
MTRLPHSPMRDALFPIQAPFVDKTTVVACCRDRFHPTL